MSIDSSLKKKSALARVRNVLKRSERIAKMTEQDKWNDDKDPCNLPKTRVFKVVAKKVKKVKKEEEGADKKKKK